MSDPFATALELVHSTVTRMQARGVPLRATMESLAQLSSLAGAAAGFIAPRVVPVEAPAPAKPPTAVISIPAPAEPPTAVISIPAPSAGGDRVVDLDALRGPILGCLKCPNLVSSRTQVVFGVGNAAAELMFVGEAPGEDEDRAGEPFVGRAGQLLTKIIETMGYARSDVYIANVLKCRPDMPAGSTGNRKPTAQEMQTCLPYLEQQIAIIRPRVLVALGATAVEGLLGLTDPMARLRGRWHDFRGIPLMATYHPAYLVRNQSLGEKRKVWEDMLLVLEKLQRPVSEKQRTYFLSKT